MADIKPILTKIEIKPHQSGFIAYYSIEPEKNSMGKTPEEALGKFFHKYQKDFGVKITSSEKAREVLPGVYTVRKRFK